jgi:hypothetical protein
MLTPMSDFKKEVATLDVNKARRVEIPLFCTHTVPGILTAQYKVPSDMRLAAFSMRGHFTGGGATTIDTAYAQAMLCRLSLQDQDSQLFLTDNANTGNYINLTDILGIVGARPMTWGDYVWTLPAAHTIRLQSTITAALGGASGEFGVVISGVLTST